MTRGAAIWASLPVPVLLIDAQDRICDLNPAAEEFLNAPASAVTGHKLWDRIDFDATITDATARARLDLTALTVRAAGVIVGDRGPLHCRIQIAPLEGGPEHMILMISPIDGKAAPATEDESLSEAITRHLQRYFDLHDDMLPAQGLYGRILREVEIPLIEVALDATGGNQAKCADLLGINRNTLRKKITSHDIEVTRRPKMM
ncbi:PAS domain-containing protein [Pontibaca sp. S1109L]|uniref:PAS domain-containing protein n=1 Tax=Pontibaca salina TaxID=2795731 RepID=A0A934M2P9_9RHOB|nr:PAS domain-containing protein [Pontibaca salina]